MVTNVDVLLVGAGLAGIGVAWHLQKKHPNKRYAILEARSAMGGTWDLFRYPGIRSDSSMHLYGYSFKPWLSDRSVADGPTILQYLREVAVDAGIDQHIRYNTRVKRASWSSETSTWTVEAEREGETITYVCKWLQMCSGYYSYKEGYTPEFAGMDRFNGQLIHPQAWPEDFDATGKRIVVIGSGATAITLIPSLAKTAKHVVMLQRSPSYIFVEPGVDIVAKVLRRLLPETWAYQAVRRKNMFLEHLIYTKARKEPQKLKAFILKRVRKALPQNYDIQKHFNPRYQPWDQRLCLAPDGDIFQSISSGAASVVTDQIDTFTEKGLKLKSGQTLEADVIVTATGLKMLIGGGVNMEIDGAPLSLKDHWIYKGVMLSGIPNMMLTSGTLIASYTLRVELIGRYLCKVLEHMDKTGARRVQPALPMSEERMPKKPFVEGFSSGYLMRAIETFPKQGDQEPWLNLQTYKDNKRVLEGAVDDGVLRFERAASQVPKATRSKLAAV